MKELKVLYRGFGAEIELGTLADDGNDVLFQYSAEAITQDLQLSPIRLPLRAAAYPDQQTQYLSMQRVPGLLGDSLPDSWGFHLMNRRLRARGIAPETLSTLDRLAYLGNSTMGALCYQPAAESLNDNKDLTLAELASEMHALMVDQSHVVLDEIARAGGSPGGARPKALVYFNPKTGQMSTQAAHVQDAEAWLVKFPASDDEADSCALEALYALIAAECDMGMTQARFFELPSGLTAFATRRFDREGQQRVHVHSLAGMLHADFQIPSLGYEDYFKATRRLTRDERELKTAVQRCVFNVLMNNRDDHARNMAFLLDRNKTWRLAPPYDLTYCPGYKGEHFMDVMGEGRAPGRSHIVQAARAAGLHEKDTADIIDRMLDQGSNIALRTLAGGLPIRARRLKEVGQAIEENRRRLLAGR